MWHQKQKKVKEEMKQYDYIQSLIARGLRTEVNFMGVIIHSFRNPYSTEIIYRKEIKKK